jgi:predicted nuclease with TOPRIM domain
LNKAKIQLTSQLEEVKRLCDDESKERQSLMGRYRNLEHEYDGMNAVYEEEMGAKDDLARQCHKAEDDANHWRKKVGETNITWLNRPMN